MHEDTPLEAVMAALDGCPHIAKGHTQQIAEAVLEGLCLTRETNDRTKRVGEPLIYQRYVTPWSAASRK